MHRIPQTIRRLGHLLACALAIGACQREPGAEGPSSNADAPPRSESITPAGSPNQTAPQPTTCQPVVTPDPIPGRAWWLDARFAPLDTIILGLSVRAFGDDWVRASVLSRSLMPPAYITDPSTLEDSTRAGFVRDDDFNDDGVIDRAITGVYETRQCLRGRFVAILRPAVGLTPQVAFLHTAGADPGFSVLYYAPQQLIWQSCMECDDVNRLQWTGSSYMFEFEGPR